MINANGLVASERSRRADDAVSELLEFSDGVGADGGFEGDEATPVIGGLSGGGGRADVSDSGGVAGLLHVHAEIDDVHQHLHVSLRLHVSAHQPEAQPRFPVLGDEGGDDGVEGSFVGFESIEVSVVQGEELASILQAESDLAGDDLRSEPVVVALDEAAAIAVLVDDSQVNRIAMLEFGVTGGDVGRGLLQVDSGVLFLAIRVGDQFGRGQFAEVRVGVEQGPVGERQFLGFDEQVDVLAGIVSHRLDVVLFEDIEHFESGDALSVGWQFPDVVASVVGRHRFDPVAVVIDEVLAREEPIVGVAEVNDPLGDLSLVERIATVFGDLRVAPGEVGVGKDLSDPGCLSAWQVGASRVGPIGQGRLAGGPAATNDLADGESVPSGLDRLGEQFVEFECSESFPQHIPTVDAARDTPGERSVDRDFVESLVAEGFP